MATHEKPLWYRVWQDKWSRVYLNAGKIIGHLGIDAVSFFDAAKKLDGYDKYHYENAVRDLTVWSKRENEGRYELTAQAKKILRVILGPRPDDPEYRTWWLARLISVKADRERGLKVEWCDVPPVPLEPEVKAEPKAEKPKAKEPVAKKEKPAAKPAAKKVKAPPAKKAKG